MINELYGLTHKTAKKILKKDNELPPTVRLVDFPDSLFTDDALKLNDTSYINEIAINGTVSKSQVYPIENLVSDTADNRLPLSFAHRSSISKIGCSVSDAPSYWKQFIENSVIPSGYRNEGIHYAGYIKECAEWCLPSWIWTNAAIVRYYCAVNEIDKAKKLGNLIIAQQQECGGWIVRNDYSKDGVTPQLAPNDSCYVALNCCMEIYRATKDAAYLDSAIRCADWCIKGARPDGLVYFGFDTKKQVWVKDRNIVDTGFTAGLFARLYEVTGKNKYRSFLEKFVDSYIKVFFMPEHKCFATAIDGSDRQKGGAFGRGQAWALEGLIPAYRVLQSKKVESVVDDTISTLLDTQLKNGGWSYNLLKPMMGEDCKATSLLAKSILEWNSIKPDKRYIDSASKALNWCAVHTETKGEAIGGIFSYTIEGAVVHHMYTSTAFVYGSSYALEVCGMLKDISEQ